MTAKKKKRIDQPIVSAEVVSGEAREPDESPLTKRIESRPEGELDGKSVKMTYYTQDGKKKVYVNISFIPVTGRVDGMECVVERPLEFFVPAGQLSEDHQWIAATMRSLSLAARAGFAAKALQDLRKVKWDRGPVRYGVNRYDKPIYHGSEVAAIAYCIQQVLVRRGFMHDSGEALTLAELNQRKLEPQETPESQTPQESLRAPESGDRDPSVIGTCGECGGDLRLLDGCETCSDCGASKCG